MLTYDWTKNGEQVKSIQRFGLSEVCNRFSDERLLERIGEASNVQMLVMRSGDFFRANHKLLTSRIINAQLQLDILLPNPRNENLMGLLSTKYSDLPQPKKLAESITNSLNTWLRNEI